MTVQSIPSSRAELRHGRPRRETRSPASWSSGPCRGLEHVFELRLPRTRDFIQSLGSLVRPFCVPHHGDGGPCGVYEVIPVDGTLPYVLTYDGVILAGGRTPEDFGTVLSWHINRSVIDSSSERYVLMHSAAVSRAGITVVLPADQESGKTTTTAGLLRHGYDYITDEAVAIDPATGVVHPFPKTLSLDPGSWPLFPELRLPHAKPWVRQWHVPPEHLGSGTVQGAASAPRVVVIPRYVRDATTCAVPLQGGEAVRRLALLTFRFRDHPGRNLRALARLVSKSTVVHLRIGSLDGAIDAIDELVSNHLLEEL